MDGSFKQNKGKMREIKFCPVMLFDFHVIGSNFNQKSSGFNRKMVEVNPSGIQQKKLHTSQQIPCLLN